MVGNKSGLGLKTWVTCVAVIAAVFIVFYLVTRDGDDNSKADAVAVKSSQPTSPVQVYPERGDMTALRVKDGRLLCGSFDGIRTTSLTLPDSGGTASYNGTLVSTEYTNDAVLITIQGWSDFVSGWATAKDGGMVPFNIPTEANGETSPGLRLEMKDFKAYISSIEDITLCSLG